MLYSSIDNFRVSNTIMLGGVNSGQTSSDKMLWSRLSCWTTTIKNCRESQASFPNFIFDGNYYIYELSEGLGMRKILAHGYIYTWIQKNAQTREDIFWIFTDFYGVMWVQSPTYSPLPSPHRIEISSMVLLTLKLSITSGNSMSWIPAWLFSGIA